MFLNISKC